MLATKLNLPVEGLEVVGVVLTVMGERARCKVMAVSGDCLSDSTWGRGDTLLKTNGLLGSVGLSLAGADG